MVREVVLVVIVPNLTDYHTRLLPALVCYPPNIIFEFDRMSLGAVHILCQPIFEGWDRCEL